MEGVTASAINVLSHETTNGVAKTSTALYAQRGNAAPEKDGVELPTIIARSRMGAREPASHQAPVRIAVVLRLVGERATLTANLEVVVHKKGSVVPRQHTAIRTEVQKPLKPKPTDSGDKNEDEDPDEPAKTPSGRKGDDEDPDSPSKTPSQEDNGNDPDVDDPKKCAPCPACPKTECPPPPRKNPASSPKFEPNAPNTIRACLCDEGEEPVVHKLAPQKLGCNWKNGQQVTIGGQNFVYECYLWQLSPHTTTVEGGSLEQCGEICSATKGCQSTNFWHSNMKMDGKESCTLLMRPVGNPSQSKPDPLSDQSVFGGSLRGL
ncbi:hypothetical protein FKW77_006496 [Venturia effusa]|uniref:Uncharacterized protein n=1 Tax=Venturia effusa TaxID=50376 RepID=A0A517LKE7_9PEZI|nr:hypothetical protein FKW77_006496 [Venturia effusa]